MKEREQDISGLNKEYFYFLIEETFAARDLPVPNHQQINQAIKKMQGLVSKVLDSSFELGNPQAIAQECGLSTIRAQELYSEGVNKVCILLESELENQQKRKNEIN